jgi:hypothetical protein
VANIIGVWTYRFFFKDVHFRKIIVITTVCFSLASLSKLMVTQQVTYEVGLSPVAFTYTSQLLYTFVNQLHLMPLMVLAAKMCPKQVEASLYAFALAVINLGCMVSYQLRGILAYSLGITATNFKDLWILVILVSVFPLLTQVILLCLPEKDNVKEEIG